LATAVVWTVIHRADWLGPRLADEARSVVGTDAVSRIEDFAYGLDDDWNRWWRRGEKPEAHWAAAPSSDSPPVGAAAQKDGGTALPEREEGGKFRPADVGPLFREMAARGDGIWVAVPDPARPDGPVLLHKTLIHPDRRRPWAELFVVAIDLPQTRLYAVAGTIEPRAEAKGLPYRRRGLIPESDRPALLAAFNGGFKAEHGHYGMTVDGITLLPPRDRACTIAAYHDDDVRIGTWAALSATEDKMVFWRQTPSCIVENAALNPGLSNEESISWGAALGGGTVVRRSAIGLNADRTVLYMGVSNATTARAIALGMQHAGASHVAQLDINWSYPRFVMFRRSSSGEYQGFGLFEGFAFQEHEYISRAATRDFFYLVRKDVSLTQQDVSPSSEMEASTP
jgi:hypothetical protein